MRSGFPDETKHEYLTDNRLKKITLRFQSASAKSTREVFYQDTSDAHAYVAGKNSHLRKTLDKKQAGAVISSFEYELDAAGNRLGVTDSAGKYTQYGLDPKRQLVSETKWSAKTPGSKEWQYLFQYDPNQNRIFLHKDGVATPYTYGDNNEMLTAGNETWTWDHFGNAKTKVVSGNTTNFGWDFESHLTSIDYPNTANDGSHEYDGNGLRMRSKLAGAANWTNFVWDELTHELLAEYTLISGSYTIKALNTHGLGLISSNREGTKRYFHFDALGSTAALADESEVVKDSYTYEAFGIVQSSTSTNGPSTNPFKFVGQWGYYDDGAMGSPLSALHIDHLDYLAGSDSWLQGLEAEPPPDRKGAGLLQLSRPTCTPEEIRNCREHVCPSKGQRYIACFVTGPLYWCACARKRKRRPLPRPLPIPRPGCNSLCVPICAVFSMPVLPPIPGLPNIPTGLIPFDDCMNSCINLLGRILKICDPSR